MKVMTKGMVAALAVLLVAAASAQQAQRPSLLNRRAGLQRNNAAARPLTPNARPTGNAPAAPSASSGESSSPNEPGGRSIEFNQAPVDMVLKVYGDLVDKTVLKDPQAPNPTITLQPRQGQELTDEDKIEAILTVLEMNGIHIEPYGEKFVRALPRKEVRKEGIPLIMDSEAKLGESTKVISLMLPFKNISVEDAQKALDNFKSASGIIIGFERTNTLLLTDTEANICRMREIARTIDIAMPVLENVFVRQIKNASAEDIKTALEAIVQESQKELEKNGKAPGNNAQPSPTQFGNSLLRRPGQQNQPQQPVNNQSLVMGISDADRGMIRGKVLILSDERSNKLIVVTAKPNMDFFDKVIEQLDVETTPDTLVKVYRLKYAEAEDVSDMINDLIGNASSSKGSNKKNENANAKNGSGANMTRNTSTAPKKPANQRTGDTKAGELSKDNTTVLADKRINGIVVMTEKELVPTVESIIESMDIKLSQVLIETVIIEVGLGDGIETGMDWVQKGRKENAGRQVKDTLGNARFNTKRSVSVQTYTRESEDDEWVPDGDPSTSMSFIDMFVGEGYSSSSTKTDVNETGLEKIVTTVTDTTGNPVLDVARNGIANYFTAGSYTALGGGSDNGQAAYNLASGVASNVFGSAFNFVFDSDELGLAAILKASKTDSRTKYIASPIIMTLDNKEATIEATQMRYLFKGYQYSGSTYNGSAVPDYEQKELGITIKVTPKINPNGTVMLTLEEEYSQKGGSQSITGQDGKPFTAETTVTRKMSADALLENNQTVIFAGLTETQTSSSEVGIPILKDIPWIGWLFGTFKDEEARSELLVFMTPYVLDDANAAEAEAIRRKKALSDPSAWDDHGWSASKLADPVARKEQMRRLKDEWKKQDEERQAKIAIEKAKVERAKKLKTLSKEERDLWLKMHKEELEEDAKEELEKKMLDKESQDELRQLAEKIRKEKLGAAEKEIKKAAQAAESQNERGRLDAEKAAKQEEPKETPKEEPKADDGKDKSSLPDAEKKAEKKDETPQTSN